MRKAPPTSSWTQLRCGCKEVSNAINWLKDVSSELNPNSFLLQILAVLNHIAKLLVKLFTCSAYIKSRAVEKINKLWVSQWTYLGVSLKSGVAFNCSVSDRLKKFYRCANAIFRIDSYSDELVMLQLAESHCIPLLTYAIEIVHVTNLDERRQLQVAYNSVYRKIFGYRQSQSVSELQQFLGKPAWEELVD